MARSQEVPHSPQIDPTPCVYPSLHSSQFLSYEDEPDDIHPVAKRVLFASDLSRHGDGPRQEEIASANHPPLLSCDEGEEREPFAVLPLSGNDSEGSVTSEAHHSRFNACLDQALEHEDILEAQALVVSLKGYRIQLVTPPACWVALSVVRFDRKWGGGAFCCDSDVLFTVLNVHHVHTHPHACFGVSNCWLTHV